MESRRWITTASLSTTQTAGDRRAFRREYAKYLAFFYFCGAGSPESMIHGQKFCGFALSLPDLMTLIFAMVILS
jgi:hypothetical protein